MSEKMKSQIRGLEQVERNILDGVSLVQTAESALSNIQEILQRARELTVQAANGTLTPQDRGTIQKEIDQLKQGIDDIANHTQFNTIEVLRPPKVMVSNPPSSLGSDKADIIFFIGDSGTMQEEINQVINGISQFVNDLSNYGDVQVGTVSTVHSGRNLPLTSDIPTIQNHLVNNHVATSGTNYAYKSLIDYAPDGVNGTSIGYRSDSKKIFVLLTDTGNEASLSEQDVKNTLEQNNIYSYVFGINISGSSLSATNNFNQSTDYDGFANEIFIPASAGDIANSISPGLANTIIADTGFGGEQELVFKPIILQVGPNKDETFTIHLFDARATNLKIDDIKVDSLEEAKEAMDKLDVALEMVSSERSKFGAYQNSLEHIHNNVTMYNGNLTYAQSRIVDTDMAKEMMEFTNRNILNQSAQAMLSQANQLPQGILQLLK